MLQSGSMFSEVKRVILIRRVCGDKWLGSSSFLTVVMDSGNDLHEIEKIFPYSRGTTNHRWKVSVKSTVGRSLFIVATLLAQKVYLFHKPATRS